MNLLWRMHVVPCDLWSVTDSDMLQNLRQCSEKSGGWDWILFYAMNTYLNTWKHFSQCGQPSPLSRIWVKIDIKEIKWKSTLELGLSSYIHSCTVWSALKVHSRILKNKIKQNTWRTEMECYSGEGTSRGIICKNFNSFTRIHSEVLSFPIFIIFPSYSWISYKMNNNKKN